MRKRKPGARGSSWLRPELRWAIYLRDSFSCAWCGICCGDMLTLDHIFPVGSPWRDNAPCRLVTACLSCNTSRRHVRLSEWLRIVRGAGHLSVAMSALARRHEPLRRDVGAWAKESFGKIDGGGGGARRGPEPWFVADDGNIY